MRQAIAPGPATPECFGSFELVDERYQRRDVVLLHARQRRSRLVGVEKLDLYLRAGGDAGGEAGAEGIERVAEVVHLPQRRDLLRELGRRSKLVRELLARADRAVGLQLEARVLLPHGADAGIGVELGAIVPDQDAIE